MRISGRAYKALVIGLVLIIVAAGVTASVALYQGNPSTPPKATEPAGLVPAIIGVSGSNGAICAGVSTCSVTLAVSLNSLAFLGISANGTTTPTYGLHNGASGTGLKGSASQPEEYIHGWKITSADIGSGTVTMYANITGTNYYVLYAADFTNVNMTTTFVDATTCSGTATNVTGTCSFGSNTQYANEMMIYIVGSEWKQASMSAVSGHGTQIAFEQVGTGTTGFSGSAQYMAVPTVSQPRQQTTIATTGKTWRTSGAAIFPAYIPVAPTGLTVGTVTASSIPLTWTNPAAPLVNDTAYWVAGASCSGLMSSASLGVATSYTVGSLSGATEYAAEVQAWNSTGASPDSSCATGTTLPTAPTSPSAAPASTTSITVTWANPSGTLTDDYVYWQAGPACGSATQIDIGSVVATYTKTGLATNTNYCFYVVAVSAGGASAASSTVTAITASVPTAPSSLTVGTVTTTTIALTWALPTGQSLINVTVYWRAGTTCGAGMTAHSMASGSATSYTVTGLTPNALYALEATAWNATGQSPGSSCVVGLTASVPAAPTGLSVAVTSTTSLTPSWANPSTGGLLNATVYYHQAATCGGVMVAVSVGSAGTSDLISGLTTNLIYAFEVTVWNATGQSADSACATAVTASVPPAPTGLSVAVTSATALTPSWVLPTGDSLVNVTVYYRQAVTCGGTMVAISTGSGAATSALVTGLTTGLPYSFEVTAWNGTGQGPDSSCATATTASVPPAPTGLSVAVTSTTSLTPSWALPSGKSLVNVTIYWWSGGLCSGPATGFHSTGSGMTVSYLITALTTHALYSVTVTDWNSTGQSPDSSCVTALTASVPPAPTGLTVVPTALTTTLAASWTLPSGDSLLNVTVYWFSGAACSGAPTVYSSGSGATVGYTIPGLTTNDRYAVMIQDWNATGGSSDSSCVSTVVASVPTAPGSFALVVASITSLRATWTLTVGQSLVNVTVYWETGTLACGGTLTAISAGLSMSQLISPLTTGVLYWAEATSWNATGQSSDSSCVSAVPSAPGAPIVTAAAINTTAITVTWSVPSGTVTNYTLMYARFYGLPIAYISVGLKLVYNVTSLGFGLTYYFTVWAWTGGLEGPPSNVAPAQTDPTPPVVPPFPWGTLTVVTTLSILGSLAFSAAVAAVISGRRGRRAEGAAAIALARSRDRYTQEGIPGRPTSSPHPSYSALPRRQGRR